MLFSTVSHLTLAALSAVSVAATFVPSPYGVILLPGMGVRIGTSNQFTLKTKGRVATGTGNAAIDKVIDTTQYARTPEYTDTSLNTGVRSAYFTTFAIPDVNFAIKFYGGVEANPTNFTSGYDGEFSGFKNVTVAAGGKPNQLLEYSIAGVPLKTYVTLAEAEGFSIVSDIDDTIRESGVAWLPTLYVNSFINDFQPCVTMPGYFASLQSGLATTTSKGFASPPTFHYLSGSPQQFLPVVQPWVEKVYPSGEFVFPPLALADGLVLGLTQYQTFKQVESLNIIKMFPNRKLILFGDSTQYDAEAFAYVYSQAPNAIQCIFIRISQGYNSFTEPSKNAPSRFTSAFANVPKSKWATFYNATTLVSAASIAAGKCN